VVAHKPIDVASLDGVVELSLQCYRASECGRSDASGWSPPRQQDHLDEAAAAESIINDLDTGGTDPRTPGFPFLRSLRLVADGAPAGILEARRPEDYDESRSW